MGTLVESFIKTLFKIMFDFQILLLMFRKLSQTRLMYLFPFYIAIVEPALLCFQHILLISEKKIPREVNRPVMLEATNIGSTVVFFFIGN